MKPKRYRGQPIFKYAFAINKKYGFCASLGFDNQYTHKLFPIIRTNEEISNETNINKGLLFPLPLINPLDIFHRFELNLNSSIDDSFFEFEPFEKFIFECPFTHYSNTLNYDCSK
jgi:hypothetical protein